MAGSVYPRQLALALPHAESLARDNFLEGPANAAGIALIDAWPEWPSRIMLVAGPEGSGKSHLAAIWAEVLAFERIGMDDDFFDLGGHSLAATRILGRVGTVFHVDLPMKALFDRPTIAGMALAILAEQVSMEQL